jgi:hypothetical protein
MKSVLKKKCLKWQEERVDGLRIKTGRLTLAIPPEEIIINATPELITQLVLKVCGSAISLQLEGKGSRCRRGGRLLTAVVDLSQFILFIHSLARICYSRVLYNQLERIATLSLTV